MMSKFTEKILCIILAFGAIISSLIGLFYSDGGACFAAENVYGQQVQMYGDGLYAYNSVLTVSSRMGADWIGILGALLLLFLCFNKRERLWKNTLFTAQSTMFVYYFACLTFSISMNRLYLLYVLCFGSSVFLSIHLLIKHFRQTAVKEGIKEKRNLGIRICLALSGGLTIIIWLAMLIPHLISQSYGELIGVLTTEVTYAIDLGILCPLMIICSIWIGKKKDIGYKLAPILLYILFCIAPMVLLQNLYCIILGIDVPVQTFIGTVLSFVIMGTFAIVYLKKSIGLITEK